MSKYAGIAKTANNLLAKNGATITFTRTTDSSFNPVTQSASSSTKKFSMKGIGVAPGRSAEYRIGTLQKRNVMEFHLAPNLGTTPQPGDKVRWLNADWTVIYVNDVNPAGDGSPYCMAYAEK